MFVYLLRPDIEKFVNETKYVRSIDGFLVRLSSLVYRIKEISREFGSDPLEIFNHILMCEEVRIALKPLVPYVETIHEVIKNDPRHKILRPFANYLLALLKTLPPEEKVLELARPSLSEIEYFEKSGYTKRQLEKYYENKLDKTIEDDLYKDYTVENTVHKRIYRDKFSEEVFNERTTWGSKQTEKVTKSSQNFWKKLREGLFDFLAAVIGEIISGIPIIFIGTIIALIIAGIFNINLFSIDKLNLQFTDNYLVVEYRGRWLPHLWLEFNGNTYHLVPYFVKDNYAIIADYVFINTSLSIAKYWIIDIFRSRSNSATAELIVKTPETSKKCVITYSNNELKITTCSSIIVKESSTTSPFTKSISIHEAILNYVNQSAIKYIRQNLLRDKEDWDLALLSIYILTWLETNTRYSYEKALSSYLQFTIYDPITFFERKSGVCVDYALFTVTALLAGGAKEAYILLIDTGLGPHAAAAVKINNTIYVLDQKLPLYELRNYLSYIRYTYGLRGKFFQIVKVWMDSNENSAIESKIVRFIDIDYKKLENRIYKKLTNDFIHEPIITTNSIIRVVFIPAHSYTYHITYDIFNSNLLKYFNLLPHFIGI